MPAEKQSEQLLFMDGDFGPLLGDLSDELLHLRVVRLLQAVCEHTRAEFHHDPRDIFELFGSHAEDRGNRGQRKCRGLADHDL